MGKYYCLIAGLPNLSLEDSKLTYSVSEFREELDGLLTRGDKKPVDLFFLKFENKNLLSFLLKQRADEEPDERGRISRDALKSLYDALKDGEKPTKNKQIPPYFAEFIEQYIESEKNGTQEKVVWEDRLSALYYDYAMKCSNGFVRDWFELNLNIGNMLTAITCRKYGLDKSEYIVGSNAVAEAIRTSNARDFGLGDEADYLPELARIAEEPDLMVREKRVDSLKWKWLDDATFFKTFDIESVFAYLLKLEMIERWVTLDKATGEKTFREIVGAMKKGSGSALDEFKRNNNK